MPTQRVPPETITALEAFMRALDGILGPLRNAPTKIVEPFQEVEPGSGEARRCERPATPLAPL